MPETQMEAAFRTIQRLFFQYGECKTCELTRDEFTKMMVEQMPDILKVLGIEMDEAAPQEKMAQLFNDVDRNKNGGVSLDEFASMVAKVLAKNAITA